MRSWIGWGCQRGSWKLCSQNDFATSKLTSTPTRSISSNGPIRKPPPIRTMRSIWSCEEIRWPSSRSASSMNGRARSVGDESDPVRRTDRFPAHRPSDIRGGGERLLGCLVSGDDFDQAHPRGGLKKCIRTPGRAVRFRPRSRSRTGTRCWWRGSRVGRKPPPACANRLALELEVLRCGFDHELAVRDVLQAWRLAEAGGRRLGGARAPAPALGPSGERLAQPVRHHAEARPGRGRGGRCQTARGRRAGRCRPPWSPLRGLRRARSRGEFYRQRVECPSQGDGGSSHGPVRFGWPLIAAMAAVLLSHRGGWQQRSSPWRLRTSPAPRSSIACSYTSSAPPRPADVLVLMPGTQGGAGDFTLTARYLERRFDDLQVWAIDRRTQALEDTTVFEQVPARDGSASTGVRLLPRAGSQRRHTLRGTSSSLTRTSTRSPADGGWGSRFEMRMPSSSRLEGAAVA